MVTRGVADVLRRAGSIAHPSSRTLPALLMGQGSWPLRSLAMGTGEVDQGSPRAAGAEGELHGVGGVTVTDRCGAAIR